MVLYLARNGTSFDPFLTYFNSASESGGKLEARKSCMYLEERKGKERKSLPLLLSYIGLRFASEGN